MDPQQPARTPTLASVSSDQLRLITKVAKLYHELSLKQTEVAGMLRISQTKVSRLLRRAEDLGLVRTVVTVPSGVNTDIETRLEQEFGLTEAIVVDDPASPELLLRTLGEATASYLDNTLNGTDVLGYSSWSATLLEAAEALLPSSRRRATEVVQVVGGVGAQAVQDRANRMVDRLAVVTGATPYYLPAPGLLDTPAAATSLLSDGSLSQVVEAWSRLTIAVVGVGSLEPSPFYRASGNAISKADEQSLRDLGVVGDILLRYFDQDGELADTPMNGRVVGIPLELFRKVPTRVAAAGGRRKASAILGALRGTWVNVLITDASTASAVIALAAK